MIAFDTNYLVRYLVQDDPVQCQEVDEVVEAARKGAQGILLPDIVLCETVWVLTRSYQARRKDLVRALKSVAEEAMFLFEKPEKVQVAIQEFAEGKADFSDYLLLHTCREFGAELKTFDRTLAKEI